MVRRTEAASDGRVRDSHTWQWRQDPPISAVNSTYGLRMTLPPDLAARRFSRLMERVLEDARAQSMTDADIRQATGVGPSTFHRWKRGEFGKQGPQLDKIRDFFDGLKRAGLETASAAAAMNALGVVAPPEGADDLDPMQNPYVRTVLRKLADPKTSPQMRATITQMLRYLANLTDAAIEEQQEAS